MKWEEEKIVKVLRAIVKNIFYKHYQIKPVEVDNDELSYACNGRIIRSLTTTKKEFCATYILNGLK